MEYDVDQIAAIQRCGNVQASLAHPISQTAVEAMIDAMRVSMIFERTRVKPL